MSILVLPMKAGVNFSGFFESATECGLSGYIISYE